MDGLTIREAGPEDCDRIIELIVQLAVYEKEDPSRVRITKEELIRDGFQASGHKWFECLVGEVAKTTSEGVSGEKTVIGYALFFHTYSTWNGRTIKIEDLYVEPAYRGKGYGTQLLKSVNEIALQRGCARVHWNVLEWNKPAIDFYKKLGAEYSDEWRMCILHRPEMDQLNTK